MPDTHTPADPDMAGGVAPFDSGAVDHLLEISRLRAGEKDDERYLQYLVEYLELFDFSYSREDVLREITRNTKLDAARTRLRKIIHPAKQQAAPQPPTPAPATIITPPLLRANAAVSTRQRAEPTAVKLPSKPSQELAHSAPMDPTFCRGNPVYQKLLLLVQLAIVDQLSDTLLHRTAVLEVRAETAPIALWEYACAFFQTTGPGEAGYGARIVQRPQHRLKMLEIVWGPHASSAAAPHDNTIELRMPLAVARCRADVAFARLFVLMQIRVADTIIINSEMHSTRVTVDTAVSQYNIWKRVAEVVGSAPGYTTAFVTGKNSSTGADETELVVTWN